MYKRNWHRCIHLLIAAAFLVGCNAIASEQVDWAGWYLGGFGGFVKGEMKSDDPSHFKSTGDFDDDSPLAGVFASHNRLFNNGWVGGLELMLPLYMQKGTAVDKQYFPDKVTYEATFRWGILLAAKAGRPYGKTLPYAYGAIGLTNVNGKTYNVDLNEQYSPGFEQSAAATHFIWQLGAGVDYRASEKIFVGGRVAAFVGAKADHTMPWNEPGPNKFGYSSMLAQFNVGYAL